MTVHLNSYTNIPGVWEKEEKMIQEKWFIGVDFLMLFDKWYIKVSYSFMRLSKWTFILPMTVCHKQWEETISLQKRGKFASFTFPQIIQTLHLCYLFFLHPSFAFSPSLFVQSLSLLKLLLTVRSCRSCLPFTSGGCLYWVFGVSSL